jgi:hypothetical protein
LLCQVSKPKKKKKLLPLLHETLVLTQSTLPLHFSYDLDMDTRLAEETTTLVESYTVSSPLSNLPPRPHHPSFIGPVCKSVK